MGPQAGSSNRHKGEQAMGVKRLGVRDLHNRIGFLACGVATAGYNKLGSYCQDTYRRPNGKTTYMEENYV